MCPFQGIIRSVRWHFLLESLAYIVAFRLYVWERQRAGDFLTRETRWSVIVAAAIGAVLGSKLLYWLEDPVRTVHQWNDLSYLLGGKTIVGALLGGTVAVELLKRRAGIERRTGDLFAVPLTVGIAIGRIGCFLAGKQDDTYGSVTSLPWGVDLGDGLRRHPVQLYEIAVMLVLAMFLRRVGPPRFREGDRFRLFVLTYYCWRLLVDFLKPGMRFSGMTVLQWACVGALIWYARDLWRITGEWLMTREEFAHG